VARTGVDVLVPEIAQGLEVVNAIERDAEGVGERFEGHDVMTGAVDGSQSVGSKADHGAAEDRVVRLLQPRLRMERCEGCVFEAPIHGREEPADLARAERLPRDLVAEEQFLETHHAPPTRSRRGP
jgi:hypothetical protein